MAKLNLRDALNTSLARTKLYIDTELAKKADSSHGTHLTLGTGSGNAFRGDYGNTAYQHSQAAHAPSNAQKNSDITKAEIEAKLTGAITSHTHSYLPLSGGTMTGAITTPNNAQGIKVGDDAVICDRNIANHIVIEGATATNGGITFGSDKDTNIYRDGPNLLKTDDKFNAVGGFQWNGQSLDNRYAASSHGTHLTIGTGSGNAAAGNHTHEFNHLIDINISNYTSIDSNSLEPIRGMKFFSNIKGNTEGMFPSERDDNCILSINRGVGNGYVTHLGFGYDGLYYRKANGTLFNNTHQWHQIYSTENKPTLADIGAAPTSHASTATTYGAASASNYGHAMASSTTPKANGTAAVGSETAKFARGDHVHPLQTTVSGNAGTATKLATARTIKIGNVARSFDGTSDLAWTIAEIGAANASHSHDVLNYQDTRSSNPSPAEVPLGLSIHLKSNGIDGLSDGGSYHPSLILKPWNDKSGWPIGQIATTQNNNLYFRVSTASSDTSWNAWQKVSKDGHTHSYLPLSGGTMTGKITTPNNAQGITIGDDVTLCDRNIADHLVLEGSTATNGGITFGSGKDTNIYRGGANILKTDDTMNAVGGFQWNGQSLDSRYAAASHGTHLTIGTGASNAAAGNHTHNYAGSSSAGGAANNSEKFGGYSLWVGTQAQYDAISSKSSTTIYIIK